MDPLESSKRTYPGCAIRPEKTYKNCWLLLLLLILRTWQNIRETSSKSMKFETVNLKLETGILLVF